MKIALTGSSGLLGSSIQKYCLSKNINILALPKTLYRNEHKTNLLKKTLNNSGIDILIHCAANTNVEHCEEFTNECYKDNYLLTKHLAEICEKLKIKLVFISSTGVYGKLKETPYIETDEVVPTTVHHRSKWLAEKAILKQKNIDYLIIRTGWLFGGNWHSAKNFVANRIKEALEATTCIKSNATQFGCPTYTDDVSRFLIKLIKINANGVFNCVNEGQASRFDYVSKIIEITGIETDVIPVNESIFNRRAKVSKNEMAYNTKLEALLGESLPSWKSSLESYIQSNMIHWMKRT